MTACHFLGRVGRSSGNGRKIDMESGMPYRLLKLVKLAIESELGMSTPEQSRSPRIADSPIGKVKARVSSRAVEESVAAGVT